MCVYERERDRGMCHALSLGMGSRCVYDREREIMVEASQRPCGEGVPWALKDHREERAKRDNGTGLVKCLGVGVPWIHTHTHTLCVYVRERCSLPLLISIIVCCACVCMYVLDN